MCTTMFGVRFFSLEVDHRVECTSVNTVVFGVYRLFFVFFGGGGEFKYHGFGVLQKK